MKTDTERAIYMAAAIDGEGSVLLIRQAADETRKSPRYRHAVQVTNTEKAWLETLQGWFGGKVYKLAVNRRASKPCYVLKFYGQDTRRILASVMPYLLIKRNRAELLLQFFELEAQRAATSRNAVQADPEIVAAQQRIWEQIAAMNRRGVGPLNLRSGQAVVRTCSVDGCDRKHYGHGYCWMHYRKYIVRGGTAYYEKACVQCGRSFVARRSDTECCSKVCSDRHQYGVKRDTRLAYAKAYRERKKAEKTSQVRP